jgi:hypothetical protein
MLFPAILCLPVRHSIFQPVLFILEDIVNSPYVALLKGMLPHRTVCFAADGALKVQAPV